MKKTISISLAGTPFIIEEDAYQTLESYLSGIRLHFANIPEHGEVVTDIEARIAEQFLESGKPIISQTEVDAVIASVGNIRDFGGNEKNDAAAENLKANESGKKETQNKRLYRNPDDKVIAGVASGIAAYIGVDTVLVRLVFILLIFADGFGILLYLALWIAMPEAKSASQKLEMSGTPVTLENLVDRVKERVEEVKKEKGTLHRIMSIPLAAIKGFFSFVTEKLVPLFRKIIGFIIGFFGSIAVIALTIGFGVVLTHLGGEYLYVPIQDIISPQMIILTAVFGYLSLIIPLIFIVFLGNILTDKKSPVSGGTAMAIIGAWFISIIISAVAGISIWTNVESYTEKTPMYREKTQTIESLAPFSEISARDGIHVIYEQGATTTVSVTGRAKDISRISVASKDGILEITPVGNDGKTFCIFCLFPLPSVTVRAPSVTAFKGENAVNFEGSGISSASKISIFLSNGSRGIFEISGSELSATVKNASYFELLGTSANATITGENGAQINAFGFTAENAVMHIANASSAKIGAVKTLNAEAKNGSSIRYLGTPIVIKTAEGGSSVQNF
ncbi:MAG: DUF2807 domain-containing protein [Candidatus Paceibacterota bacterium]|jgi:phage shock protein PspC (stress-responsive transcriptional regulator)